MMNTKQNKDSSRVLGDAMCHVWVGVNCQCVWVCGCVGGWVCVGGGATGHWQHSSNNNLR